MVDLRVEAVRLAQPVLVRGLLLRQGRLGRLGVTLGPLGLQAGGVRAPEHSLVEMNDDGDAVELAADADAVVLFGHAEPIGEPVVAHGPFVMNTREEIVQAIQDYQAGAFGRLVA